MLFQEILEITLFLCIITFLAYYLGKHIAHVAEGKATFFHPFFQKLESLLYRILKVDPEVEMTRERYLFSVISLCVAGFFFLITIFLLQYWLPLNPDGLPGMPFYLAFNATISFVTGTNWQGYISETTLSPFSQIVGITVQNFLSSSVGIALGFTILRAFKRQSIPTIGNFWVDNIRSLLYILLPLSLALGMILIYTGVPQTLTTRIDAITLEGQKQILPLGPVASQIAIRQLGNGGSGYFTAGSAHPFQNPSYLSNWFELAAILIIPASFPFAFGFLTKPKNIFYLYIIPISVIIFEGAFLSFFSNQSLEGIETRIGPFLSYFWTVISTATANGSFNSDIVSLHPSALLTALFNMTSREVFFGGVGIGFATLLFFAILTEFLVAHMIGRSPEFFSKKIHKKDIQWICIGLVIPICSLLMQLAISLPFFVETPDITKNSVFLTEFFYIFSSTLSNNGSTLVNFTASPFMYIILSIGMLAGKASIITAIIFFSSEISRKSKTPRSPNIFSISSFSFSTPLFFLLLFFPTLFFLPIFALGPVLEWILYALNPLGEI